MTERSGVGSCSNRVRAVKAWRRFAVSVTLRAWQFCEWRKRLRDSETAKFVEVQTAAPMEPMRLVVARSSAIEIRLSEGRSLVVEPGFEASHLRALLAVLESEVALRPRCPVRTSGTSPASQPASAAAARCLLR